MQQKKLRAECGRMNQSNTRRKAAVTFVTCTTNHFCRAAVRSGTNEMKMYMIERSHLKKKKNHIFQSNNITTTARCTIRTTVCSILHCRRNQPTSQPTKKRGNKHTHTHSKHDRKRRCRYRWETQKELEQHRIQNQFYYLSRAKIPPPPPPRSLL